MSRLAAMRRGYVTWSQDFRGKESSLGNIFWFLQNVDTFCYLMVQTAPCYVPSFCGRRTDGRTDRQTDGIAIASTALAMGALRRAVKMVSWCMQNLPKSNEGQNE